MRPEAEPDGAIGRTEQSRIDAQPDVGERVGVRAQIQAGPRVRVARESNGAAFHRDGEVEPHREPEDAPGDGHGELAVAGVGHHRRSADTQRVPCVSPREGESAAELPVHVEAVHDEPARAGSRGVEALGIEALHGGLRPGGEREQEGPEGPGERCPRTPHGPSLPG